MRILVHLALLSHAKESAMSVDRRIRDLFLHPTHSYSVADTAKLLGLRPSELHRWIASGEIEADGNSLPWEEVASFAMDWWSQEVVEQALGKDVAKVIPELLRLRELHVRIPAMEVVALERVAGREGKTVDAVLARELLDFVSVHGEGFGEALAWPG
jgi:hypothetical protein